VLDVGVGVDDVEADVFDDQAREIGLRVEVLEDVDLGEEDFPALRAGVGVAGGGADAIEVDREGGEAHVGDAVLRGERGVHDRGGAEAFVVGADDAESLWLRLGWGRLARHRVHG
jgi:hypothetical protein